MNIPMAIHMLLTLLFWRRFGVVCRRCYWCYVHSQVLLTCYLLDHTILLYLPPNTNHTCLFLPSLSWQAYSFTDSGIAVAR